ncbi:MAG: hypothetical protein H6626_07250 [Pseudobdellovibrionaceae bacterium]|nr:hypothetical protein [Bdellovibrionales bacterium]USN48877.1 MAG: hypothetical protein H6626_07250 [Pseudobdellovibrionaceae bacterium]
MKQWKDRLLVSATIVGVIIGAVACDQKGFEPVDGLLKPQAHRKPIPEIPSSPNAGGNPINGVVIENIVRGQNIQIPSDSSCQQVNGQQFMSNEFEGLVNSESSNAITPRTLLQVDAGIYSENGGAPKLMLQALLSGRKLYEVRSEIEVSKITEKSQYVESKNYQITEVTDDENAAVQMPSVITNIFCSATDAKGQCSTITALIVIAEGYCGFPQAAGGYVFSMQADKETGRLPFVASKPQVAMSVDILEALFKESDRRSGKVTPVGDASGEMTEGADAAQATESVDAAQAIEQSAQAPAADESSAVVGDTQGEAAATDTGAADVSGTGEVSAAPVAADGAETSDADSGAVGSATADAQAASSVDAPVAGDSADEANTPSTTESGADSSDGEGELENVTPTVENWGLETNY